MVEAIFTGEWAYEIDGASLNAYFRDSDGCMA